MEMRAFCFGYVILPLCPTLVRPQLISSGHSSTEKNWTQWKDPRKTCIPQRVTKILKGLECSSCGERLRELGLMSMGIRGISPVSINTDKNLNTWF